ncbi:hypothetical protein QE152_g7912 [Popillia japonica]|uniref:YqaJ viral recombinase domain-containing protein n=1 Tax=Popillia japonica TaxID=7064 RepID=A0AAW1MCK0_POPJA
MEGIKAIHWGKENEMLALTHLEQEFSVKVSPTSLWLDNCGFIGASPDGLVGTDSIVEGEILWFILLEFSPQYTCSRLFLFGRQMMLLKKIAGILSPIHVFSPFSFRETNDAVEKEYQHSKETSLSPPSK